MLPFIFGGHYMTRSYTLYYKSPIGTIEIIGSTKVIRSIMFCEEGEIENLQITETPMILIECYNQLNEYFNGHRKQFTFPYEFEGTLFQKSVWNALEKMPYAKIASYKDIASLIGNENAIRAVGNANSKNKLSIVIPCHRIIGSSGKLTGYAGGLWRKEWLLQHEKAIIKNNL